MLRRAAGAGAATTGGQGADRDPRTMRRTLIHDCSNTFGEPGRPVDDGLALLYLLRQPDIALVGVTTCFGGSGLPALLRATRRVLDLAGNPLPISAGATGPGLRPTAAAHFLVEATAAEPGRLTILATGPLSNLATAAAIDPGFLARCAGIICLGGSLTEPAAAAPWLGWRRISERNFDADPDAARHILAQRHCPVTVVPATSCLDLRLGWEDLARLPAALRQAVRNALIGSALSRGMRDLVAWSVVPALLLTKPSLMECETVRVTLGGRGTITSGPPGQGFVPHRLLRRLRHTKLAKTTLLQALAAY
jgi:inosine-uridine nucleoside N-ribohydrolase